MGAGSSRRSRGGRAEVGEGVIRRSRGGAASIRALRGPAYAGPTLLLGGVGFEWVVRRSLRGGPLRPFGAPPLEGGGNSEAEMYGSQQ